jgi:hypothetical protein
MIDEVLEARYRRTRRQIAEIAPDSGVITNGPKIRARKPQALINPHPPTLGGANSS